MIRIGRMFVPSQKERLMKSVAIILAALLAVASVSGCTTYGKGKAPPVVETNG
jgi:hypothetical protein